MHLILTGATGLVGSGVLDAMLAMPEITRISILSRRPIALVEDRRRRHDAAVAPDRVRVLLHRDFAHYDDALLCNELRGASGVVWALGVSQTAVDKDQYVAVTKDYTLAAARAFQRIPADDPSDATAAPPSEPFRFVFVSGEGATTTPGRLTPRFGRVKGETELALAALADAPESDPAAGRRPLHAVSVRPAGVDATGHTAILPFVPTPTPLIRATRAVLLPLMTALYPRSLSPTPALGRFLTDTALGRYDARLAGPETGPGIEAVGAHSHIVSNLAFRRLAGLDA